MKIPKLNPIMLNIVQTIFISALLMLFGITSYTLVQVGGDTYERILAKREENADARIVCSYISMRARQYDTEGGVSIRNMEDGTKALIFTEYDGEQAYETRVYHHEGSLYESHIRADIPFDKGEGFVMVNVDKVEFDIQEVDGNKLLTVEVRTGQDERQKRSALIMLRAA